MVSFLLLYQLHYYSSIKPICNVLVFPFLIFQDFLTWKLGSSKVTVQGELRSISFITSSPKGVIYPHAKCPLIPSIHLQWIYSIPTGYVWVLSFRLFLFFKMSVFTRLFLLFIYISFLNPGALYCIWQIIFQFYSECRLPPRVFQLLSFLGRLSGLLNKLLFFNKSVWSTEDETTLAKSVAAKDHTKPKHMA